MENTEWKAVTLWLPPGKSKSEVKRLLAKWAHKMMKMEGMGVAYFGGLFGTYSRYPPHRMQWHAHLILTALDKKSGRNVSDIEFSKWENEWRVNIVHLPSKRAAELKPGYDLQGWSRYIFEKNSYEADDWQSVYYNTRLLY